MSGKAAKTQLTTRMCEVLRQLSFSRSVGNGIVMRAKIILMAFEKNDNQTTRRSAVDCRFVAKQSASGDSVGAIPSRPYCRCNLRKKTAAFQRATIECLSDAPRSGSPGKFTPEQIMGPDRHRL